jgi:crotonobetainyl-CoA:carnitine CoA-transferase CaiB-like acyl-CoA transferase
MYLADLGADVVKVEPPAGDPERERPGFAMWNRGKRGVVADPGTESGRDQLRRLLASADVCIQGGDPAPVPEAEPDASCTANPRLVYLSVPPYLGPAPWYGGKESAGLLAAATGIARRQNSFDGGPVDPVSSYVLYAQAGWAAACAVAALIERQASGRGQHVTVGGVHGSMITSTASLVIDRSAPEAPSNSGPGGPSAMYTRYQCADGKWVFLATLIQKFQRRALEVLGLEDILADERVGGNLENMLLPANRTWIKERFARTFASRTSTEWLTLLKRADVPVGPLLDRDAWLGSPEVASIGMRAELEDPHWGKVAMPANPVRFTKTPVVIDRPAPRLGEHTGAVTDWSAHPAPPAPPATPSPSSAGPLSGVRVLDLGAILAGPYAGTLLAGLGADVVKVEVPEGDSWRDRGMPYIRGQRGLAIDLRAPAGHDAFCRLVRTADVVLDNYRAGVLGRLGIGYAELARVNPGIVTLSITAFGEESPYAGDPAFDPLLQARSGMMTAQGGDSEPVLLTVAVNDVITASLAVLGTVAAVFHQRAAGEGQRVTVTLAGTATIAQSEALIEAKGRKPPVLGDRDFRGPSAFDRAYATSDGWVRLQAPDGSGPALRRAGLVYGPDPATEEEWVAALTAGFAALSRSDAVAALSGEGIPAVPARKASELPDDADCRQWEIFETMQRGDLPPTLAPGHYAWFSRTRRRAVLKPPGVGEHSTEVLREAGLSETEIADLGRHGHVRQGDPIVYRSFAAYR